MALVKMWLIHTFFSPYWENTLLRERHQRHGTLVQSFSTAWKWTNIDKSFQSASWIFTVCSFSSRNSAEHEMIFSSPQTQPSEYTLNFLQYSMAEFVQHMYVPGNTTEKLRSTLHSLWVQRMTFYIWAGRVSIEVLTQLGLFWNGSLQIC